jgi:hypothetical protein
MLIGRLRALLWDGSHPRTFYWSSGPLTCQATGFPAGVDAAGAALAVVLSAGPGTPMQAAALRLLLSPTMLPRLSTAPLLEVGYTTLAAKP